MSRKASLTFAKGIDSDHLEFPHVSLRINPTVLDAGLFKPKPASLPALSQHNHFQFSAKETELNKLTEELQFIISNELILISFDGGARITDEGTFYGRSIECKSKI